MKTMLKTIQNQIRDHSDFLQLNNKNRIYEALLGPEGNIHQVSFQPSTYKAPHALTISSEGRKKGYFARMLV